jgi:hypothetical protein
MHAVICRRLERYIPYPPQPYLLTCPQVRKKKTFEAEQIKLEIDDEKIISI